MQQFPGSPGRALGTTALCVGLACAGAQLRPAEMDCPAEARSAMKALHQQWGVGPNVLIDHQHDPNLRTPFIVRSGPITSKVQRGFGGLIEGTLLFGELFTEGTNVYGRYDRAQTPDGKTYPVCFTLGNEDEDGLPKGPDTRPGAAEIARWAPITAVKRFVFKEPPKPED
jgi:serine/threonine-protein kinase